ncbi:MotA/TolQ/ExbB proton channel family protein [bacterium]|nr:MAG: MotA/TolQ/ExbB proton channel family protein [bacterium]
MEFFSQFAGFFQNGGPFMIVILLTGVAVLALTLERIWVIGRAASVNSGKLTRDLLRLVGQGDYSKAVVLAKKVKGPVGEVAVAILDRRAPASEEKLQNASDGAATIALPPLSRRLPYLSMLANSATLLGLLGTIFGLTTAFSAVGAADPSQRSAFLAAGISQALNTTAFGLIVAVPTLLIHGFLVSKVEAIVESVDEASIRIIRAMSGGDAA